MKKHFLYLIRLCTAGVLIFPAKAQKRIVITEVNKIVLDYGNGSAGRGGENFEFEILNEQGKWNSYQVGLKVTDSKVPELNINSIERKQLGTLSVKQVAGFLKCLAVVKPKLNARTYHITATALIHEIKQRAKDTGSNTIKLNEFITDVSVQRAINNVMYDGSVDTYDYCRVRIIKNDNDTVKIETNHSYATMQPWTIDKVYTYDMGINDFFIAAIFGRNYPNVEMLSLQHLKDVICAFIDGYYKSHPIGTYRRKYCITDNVELLKANFKPDFEVGEGPNTYNRYDLKLQTKAMSDNMAIYAYMKLEERPIVLALVNYSKQLDRYLKGNNFALQYYRTHPQYILEFKQSHPEISQDIAVIKQNISALKDVDMSQAFTFSVSEVGKVLVHPPDWFLLLPDNRFVMVHHYLNQPGVTFTPVFPPVPDVKGYGGIIKYVLFNADGTVAK